MRHREGPRKMDSKAKSKGRADEEAQAKSKTEDGEKVRPTMARTGQGDRQVTEN